MILLRASLLLVLACAAPALDPATRAAAALAERRADWPRAALLWSDLHRQSRGLEPEACRGLAVALWRSGALEAARRVLEPALERFPEDAELRRLAGEVALAQERPQDALLAWEAALALEPERLELALRLAELALAQGRRDLVLDHVDPERWPAGERGPAHLVLARALRAFDPRRVSEFRAAFALGLGEPEHRLDAALAALEGEPDLNEVASWLGEVVHERPQNALAQRSLAEVWLRQGNLARAEAAARRAAELEPGEPTSFASLAQVLWARERPDEALACLVRARELGPDPLLATWLDLHQEAWTAKPEPTLEVPQPDAAGDARLPQH